MADSPKTAGHTPIFGAILVVLGFYALAVLGLRWVGLDSAQEWLGQFGMFSWLVFILIAAVSLILAPLSSSSLYILGGTLFGKNQAFALSLVATLLGCSANFWLARCWGRRVVTRLVGAGHIEALDGWFADLQSHHSIFYMFLVMHLSQDMVSYALGLTRIVYRDFLIALALSAPTIVGFYIYLGSGLLNWLVGI